MSPSVPYRIVPPASAAVALVAVVAAGIAAWLIATEHPRQAGAAVITAGLAVGLSAAWSAVTGRPRAVLLDEVADRVVDAAVLAALTWTFFASAPRVAAAALLLLSTAAVTAYLRARGRGLGFALPEWPWYRAARGIAVGIALAAGHPEPGLWVALGLAVSVGAARWVAVARQGTA
jgi:hypothetical protein